MVIELAAPAKVNLCLHVTGRRPDGYHDLVTLLQKIDLHDLLTIELTDHPAVTLTCDHVGIPTDHLNLAVRAASALLRACNRENNTGLKIGLRKRIPAAAGLGGGSSDGAVVLKGLNNLLDEPLSEQELMEVGRSLGADFGFFVSDFKAALATGIGDTLTEAPPADQFHYLLVNPGIRVETAWVYRNFQLTNKSDKFIHWGSQNSENAKFKPGGLHNDLEQVTIARYPVIDTIKKHLLDEGASGALMSGSGPTVFGLFDQRNEAEAAYETVVRRFRTQKGYSVFLAKAYTGA